MNIELKNFKIVLFEKFPNRIIAKVEKVEVWNHDPWFISNNAVVLNDHWRKLIKIEVKHKLSLGFRLTYIIFETTYDK